MFTRFIFENEIVFALLKSDRLVSTPWFRVSDSLRNYCGRKGKKETSPQTGEQSRKTTATCSVETPWLLVFKRRPWMFHYLELFAQVLFLIRVSWKRLSRAR